MSKHHNLGTITFKKGEIIDSGLPQQTFQYILGYDEKNDTYTLTNENYQKESGTPEELYAKLTKSYDSLDLSGKTTSNATIKVVYNPLSNTSPKNDQAFLGLVNYNGRVPVKQDLLSIYTEDGRHITFQESNIKGGISFQEKTGNQSIQSRTYFDPENLMTDFYKSLNGSKLMKVSISDKTVSQEALVEIGKILNLVSDTPLLVKQDMLENNTQNHKTLLSVQKENVVSELFHIPDPERKFTIFSALSEGLPENSSTLFSINNTEELSPYVPNIAVITKQKTEDDLYIRNNTEILMERTHRIPNTAEAAQNLQPNKRQTSVIQTMVNKVNGDTEYSMSASKVYGIETFDINDKEPSIRFTRSIQGPITTTETKLHPFFQTEYKTEYNSKTNQKTLTGTISGKSYDYTSTKQKSKNQDER